MKRICFLCVWCNPISKPVMNFKTPVVWAFTQWRPTGRDYYDSLGATTQYALQEDLPLIGYTLPGVQGIYLMLTFA